jgi:NADH dehydrogenase/NADH:ubiquinone oxidoreductase subunit G
MASKPVLDDTDRAPTSVKFRKIDAGDVAAIGGKVTVTIDGEPLQVPLGTTILEACRQHGIHVPTLCHHDDLCIAGVCRVCVVEVEGQRTLQASCAYPITSPLNIKTHSPKVRRARRHVIDLLLSEHYGECYACGRNNNCELQALAKEYGVDMFRFGHPEEPMFEIDTSSHSVVRDMNKCVLCRRCIRTCIDLQEVGVLEVLGRGPDSRVTTFMDKP